MKRAALLLKLSRPLVSKCQPTKYPAELSSFAISSSSSPSSHLHLPKIAAADRRRSPPVLRSLVTFFTATSSDPRELSVGTDEEEGEEWEEEEEVEPVIGDGGDGGGVVLGEVAWGERILSVAREVLLDFRDGMIMYSLKVSPRGYIYVRLDKLTTKYGCPSMEEIEKFNNLYKKRLNEIGERGEIPADLGLEVSSPGAERLLKVPRDLDRFKAMPMRVKYLDEGNDGSKQHQLQERVLMLESIHEDETGFGLCMWKLADVKENRADLGKGRPLSRKHKDWRLRLPFDSIQRVMLFLGS